MFSKSLIALVGCVASCSLAYGADKTEFSPPMNWSFTISAAASAWADKADDDDNNNFGGTAAANLAILLPNTPFGIQAGVRGGLFDYGGREDEKEDEQENHLFVTVGAFKQADPNGTGYDALSYGAVWDFFDSRNYGEAADDITMQQVRGEIGYYFWPNNQIGIFGAKELESDVAPGLSGDPTIHVIDHIGLYWQRHWDNGAVTRLGVASADSVGADVLFTGRGQMPLSENSSVFGSFAWIPQSTAGDEANGIQNRYSEQNASVRFGYSYTFGGNRGPEGPNASPLFDVGHNGNFLKKAPRGGL